MRLGTMGFLAAATLLALPAFAAEKKCNIQMYGELPVTMRGTEPLISGTINGIPVTFVADSGAFFSMLTPPAAARTNLRLGNLPNWLHITGVGGEDTGARLATAPDFSLNGLAGGRVIHKVDFVVTGNSSLLVGHTDGLIGENVLGANKSDTEYDLGKGVIRIMRSTDCGDRPLAYWAGTQTFAEVSIDARDPAHPHIVGTATVNGKKIRVVFDTGAARSILNPRAAERAGLKLDSDQFVGVGISGGIGNKLLEVSTARFDEFDIGGEKIKNARLNVGSANFEIASADMLLGADFFLSHRIYVATKQRKVYFTFNGGRVFDLVPIRDRSLGREPKPATIAAGADAAPATDAGSAATAVASAATTATTATSAAAADPNEPKNAVAYRLRGAAFAGRQDFVHAIADFDRAIELDPSDAENFYQRGMARRMNRQPALAVADFNETLRLKPEYVAALMERGTLRLANNNLAGARTDFDTAGSLSPNDTMLGLQVASLYSSMRHYTEAIDRYNVWISTHPNDSRIVGALSGRCWARTLANVDLDAALEDCNMAIKKGATNSQFFDYRALLLLKRNELDKSIKDFNASLKLQPRSAMPLYGLGVAQSKKGSKSDGEKNMQAATAINPQIAEFYKRQSLAP